MTNQVDYERPPPANAVHLVCHRDGFTLTLPPMLSAVVAHAVVGLGLSSVLAIAAWKLGLPGRLEPWGVWVGWGLLVGVMLAGSAVSVLAAVAMLRSCRALTTLSLHRGMILCTVPGLFRPTTKRIPAAGLAGAEIVRPDSDGGGPYLAVRRKDGRAERLLSTAVYRTEDVEYAAEVLKEWVGDAAEIRSARACEGRPCPRCGSPQPKFTASVGSRAATRPPAGATMRPRVPGRRSARAASCA